MTTTIAPSLGHGVLDTQAGVGTSPGYDAIDRRRFWTGFERGEGVATYGSFRISQRGAGANMSVDVNQDDGAYVRGDAVTLQGLYYIPPHSATINETVTAADPTNPRIDRVVLEIKDNTHDASGSNLAQTRVVAGTPSGGATLDNLTGAAAVPTSAILLADVLVPALATTVVDANIRDRRPFTAGIPPLLTDVDMAPLLPSPFLPLIMDTVQSGGMNSAWDLQQVAALMYLPRRIVGATRIRWRYTHSTTGGALAGNYVLGLYDSSGRKIVDTGSVAYTGAAGSTQTRAETIASTTLEPGWYYLLFGNDTSSGANTRIYFQGVTLSTIEGASGGVVGAFAPNVGLRSASGGITAPATLLGMTDAVGLTVLQVPCVPLVTLSVG